MSIGGSGGGGSQSNSQIASLNPVSGLLGQLFGLQTRARSGGIGFGKQGFSFFGPEQQFSPDQFDPQSFFGSELTGGTFDINRAAQGLRSAVDTGVEAVETGLFGDSINQFQNIFRERIIPEIQTQFGALGLNQNDSDFGAALAREGSLGAAQLAAAAQDRRLAATAQAPSLIGALPGTEAALRATARNRKAGVQSLNQLFGLAGINTQGQSTSTSRTKSQGQGQAGVR
jgi:hypothetical protein